MNSKLARTILFTLLAIVFVSSVSAGWHKYSFEARTDIKTDGSMPPTTPVDFWVYHDAYDSRFTIYKPSVGGLRVYITFDGISWQAFQQYMIFGASKEVALTMPDGKEVVFGGIDMKVLDDKQADIKIEMILSKEFLKLYHHHPSVGIRVIGQPGQIAGRSPKVSVDVKGGIINVVKVDYPRAAITINNGVTNASAGEVAVEQSGGEDQSSIGGVMVRGGIIKNCTAQRGIGRMVVKGKRFKKTFIIGGSYEGDSKTEGKVSLVYASNGLKGKVTSGEAYAPNGIRKIVCVRGGDSAQFIAGGDTAAPIGSIGKIVVNLKQYGKYTTLNNCKFYCYNLPKVKICKKATIAGVTSCTVTTLSGTFPIDATYKNLVK